MTIPTKLTKDLEGLFTKQEVTSIINGIKRNASNREKHVLENYSSCNKDSCELHIHAEDRSGFAIDIRKGEPTFGNICG